ncbi:Low-density lipoprotein receptor-related protein 6 [Mytilus coruscus]|uniref:Low-density lipoprotein receptor-related protein 6 n=1 Tax=Mytilus coruscus TaxID=42192 RepID=A0A6J8C626_MYTCO|nr:Low-density lipoprotein receptor-related protein 6 [Mytilus coruscus]
MIQVRYIYADGTTKLLYSSRTNIWLLDVNSGNKIEIARTSNAVAIDYHKRKGYVYWTDVGTVKISRIRYPSTSNVTIIENVVSDDIGHPDGIAVDSVNDHIYWTDTGLNRIMRSNLDGSNKTLIVDTGLEEPRAIELDTTDRWIYFSDWGSKPKIEKCMFDGSSRQTIIIDDIQWPNGIALDFIQKRLYWCDAGKNQIKSSNFDGSDVQVILKSSLRVPHPFDIDIDEDNIYFTDWDYREVFKLSKSSSTPGSLQVETNRPMGLKIYRTNLDQCSNYSTIQNEEKRSIGYTLDLSLDVPISDNDLQDNWYRVISDNGDRIPTFPPGSLRCGTYMPIWLNGSLPSAEDDIVTRQVCKQTSTDTCGKNFDIQIKQCPGYYIYYLRNTSVNAAYCFGEGYVKCEDGLSSESGNYPGCSSTFPNNTISPGVNALLVEGKIYGVFPNPTPSLTPVFRCNFEDISNGSYVYDVYWYINGENITHHKNVLRNDINTTDLRDTDWIDRYKLNMDVKCSVRSRYSFDSIPGPYYFSENFKAGFFPEAYEFTVTEGETINISFTATVPVGCFLSDSRRAQCDMKFYISQPDNNEPSCSNNIVSRDIVFDLNNCGLELPSLAWNESVRLVVRGYSDGIYNHRDRTTFIRLSTRSNSPENNLWRSVNIPEITVTVLDKDSVLNSRLCQSYNDPHITTFDGILYHYMNVGEFVMYTNDIGPYWVHVLFTNCGFGWEGSSCNGGIAIRSRTSLFVFRTVQEISRTEKFLLDQPFTEHINCDDSDMSIDHANNVYTVKNTKILYSNRDKILLLYTDTLSEKVIVDPSSEVVAVDYHPGQNLIFWTEIGPATISRLHYSLIDNRATAVTVIISESIQNPEGIAIDPFHDHVYWVDSGTDQIVRANLEGSNRTVIVNSNLDKPRAIELDPSNEMIYFSDWGSIPKIERCKFDGSNRQAIITTDVYWPNGIALDLTEEKLFWCDAGLHQIKSANFDGSDVKLIRKSSFQIAHPFDIEVDGNHLYFGSWNHDALFKIKKVPQSSPELIVEIQPNDPMGLKIYRSNIGNCYNYVTIVNEEKRSTGYALSSPKEQYISDEGLEPGWYRIISENGDHMPISTPGVEKCGTKNPIWLNGEGPVKCDEGLESVSGYYPGCASSFPNETLIPEVQPFLKENITYPEKTSPSLRTTFKCKFEDVSNGEYVYDVYWYINDNSVTVHQNVPFNKIDTTDLLDSEWADQYNMNMKVKCSIKIRFVEYSIPGPFMTSSVFDAGFFPDAYEYNVTEGEILNIAFTSTVPVGCFSSEQNLCSQSIYISTPTQQQGCSNGNNIQQREIVFNKENCGMELPSLNWNKSLYLDIHGYSDGIYNHADRTTYIRLFTNPNARNSTLNMLNIWRNLTVPEISVKVLDKDNVLTTRLCSSYNDPHITTFDGLYYHYMNVGEFVMYRNDNDPYWVHALFTNCGWGWVGSSCNCGVAVRSRRSLFVIRTCREISRTQSDFFPQPRTYRINCDENDMFINPNDNGYIVTLPSGAEIRIDVSSGSKFINPITIKPTIYDIGETKGLCGHLSETKDATDDFKKRDGSHTDDTNTFGDSWKIDPSGTESLFNNFSYILSQGVEDTLDPLKRYCVCEREATSTGPLNQFNSLKCNLTTEFCLSDTGNAITAFSSICSSNSRKRRSSGIMHKIYRRSTTDSDDVTEFEPLTYNEDVVNTEIPEINFRNGWTEESANQTCHERLNHVVPSDLFGEIAGASDTDFIEACIMDIKLTGDTSFIQDTARAMQTITLVEAYRNETLSILKTDNGTQTILEYATSFLCSNNCSGNGNCTTGTCYCFDGFVGPDCSQEVTVPPSNISVPQEGLCGTRSRACRRTNIYGIFPTSDVWCKRNHFQILEGETVYISNGTVVKADYRNGFMVTCELQSSRRKRSTAETIIAEGYEISVSNDGIHFGDSVRIIIYDELCHECNSTTITCVELDGCPYFTTARAETTTLDETTTQTITTQEITTHITTTQDITTKLETDERTSTVEQTSKSTMYDVTTTQKVTTKPTTTDWLTPTVQLSTQQTTNDGTITSDVMKKQTTSGLTTPTTHKQSTLSEATTKLTTDQLTTTAELTTETTAYDVTTSLDETTKPTTTDRLASTEQLSTKQTTYDGTTTSDVMTKQTTSGLTTPNTPTQTTSSEATTKLTTDQLTTTAELTTERTTYDVTTSLDVTTKPTTADWRTSTVKISTQQTTYDTTTTGMTTKKITSGVTTPTTHRQTTLSEVTTKLTTDQLTTTAELTTETTTSDVTTSLDVTTKPTTNTDLLTSTVQLSTQQTTYDATTTSDVTTKQTTSCLTTPTTHEQTISSEATTMLTTDQVTTTAEQTTQPKIYDVTTSLDVTTKFTSPKMTSTTYLTPQPTTFEITSPTIITKTTKSNDLMSTADQSTQTTPYEVTSTTDKAKQTTSGETTPSTSYMFKTTLEKTTNPTKGVIETQSTKVGDTTISDTTKQPTITSTTQSTKFEPTTQEVTTEDTKLTTTSGRTTQKFETSATTKNLQTTTNSVTTRTEQKTSPLEEDTSTKADETSVIGKITTSDTQIKNEVSDESSDEIRVVYVISSSFGAVIIVALIVTAIVSLYYRSLRHKKEKISSRNRSQTRYNRSEISSEFDAEDWTFYAGGSFQYDEKEMPFTNFRSVKRISTSSSSINKI